MPQIGPLEILLVMVVALLVFGPEKLPEMARNLGRTATQLRRMAQDMKDEFATALDDDEDRPAPGSSPTRPRAAGALPGDDDAAGGDTDADDAADDESPSRNDAAGGDTDADDAADDESSSINEDIERLNSQQQDTETSAGSGTKIDRSE